jgi:integrase
MGAGYQDGCVTRAKRKRGPDVWEFRWRENGKQRCSVLGSVKELRGIKEAKKAADHIRMRVNRFAEMPARMSFGLVAEHYKANELGEHSENKAFSTKQTNSGYLTNWLLPKWKGIELEALRAIEVEQWLATLDLEPGTKAKLRNLMSGIYSHAKRYGWITHNPIEAVRQSAKRSRVPSVLSVDEVIGLLSGLPLSVRLMVVLAVFCGLRRSEIVGLKWGDIDWEMGSADVSRGMVSQVESRCKTEVSRKAVPLHADMLSILKQWHSQTMYGNPEHWIFASASKRAGDNRGLLPVWPATVMRYWIVPAAKKVGITVTRGWGWHSFRHTFGTLLKANGEDVKTVQELMRHANSKITLDTYVQGVTDAKRGAQSRIVEQVLHRVTLGKQSEAVN